MYIVDSKTKTDLASISTGRLCEELAARAGVTAIKFIEPYAPIKILIEGEDVLPGESGPAHVLIVRD